jgi:hypothetical protein
LPFEPRWNGFYVLLGAEFVSELSDALGAILRNEDRDLAQPLRSWRSGGREALVHQRAAADDGTRQNGESALRASERATENTQELCYIRLNSLLPVRVLIKSGEGPARGAKTDRAQLRRLLDQIAAGNGRTAQPLRNSPAATM